MREQAAGEEYSEAMNVQGWHIGLSCRCARRSNARLKKSEPWCAWPQCAGSFEAAPDMIPGHFYRSC